jgi:hypothetical protein
MNKKFRKKNNISIKYKKDIKNEVAGLCYSGSDEFIKVPEF